MFLRQITLINLPDNVLNNHLLPLLGSQSLSNLAKVDRHFQHFVTVKYSWKSIGALLSNNDQAAAFFKFLNGSSKLGTVRRIRIKFGKHFDLFDPGTLPELPGVLSVAFICEPVKSCNAADACRVQLDISSWLQKFVMSFTGVKHLHLESMGNGFNCCSHGCVCTREMVFGSEMTELRTSVWNLETVNLQPVKRESENFVSWLFSGTISLRMMSVNYKSFWGPTLARYKSTLEELETRFCDVGDYAKIDNTFENLTHLIVYDETFVTSAPQHLPQTLTMLTLHVGCVCPWTGRQMQLRHVTTLNLFIALQPDPLLPGCTATKSQLIWKRQVSKSFPTFVATAFPSLKSLSIQDYDGKLGQLQDKWLYPFGDIKDLRVLKLKGISVCTGAFLLGNRFKKLEIVEFRCCNDVLNDVLRVAARIPNKDSVVKIMVYPHSQDNYEMTCF